MTKQKITPFSNGTEADTWTARNCDTCVRAWFPDPDKTPPSDKAVREYVRIGKYCRLQYYLDLGHVTGEIPSEIAEKIGKRPLNDGLNVRCNHYSENPAYRFKYPSAVPPRIDKMKAIDLDKFERRFEQIKDIVKQILKETPATRDDDTFLLWAYMYRIEPSLDTIPVSLLFQRMIRGDFGNIQTVFRARRHLQEWDPTIRGKWYGTRKKRADVISEYHNDYRAQFMGSFSGDYLFTQQKGGEK